MKGSSGFGQERNIWLIVGIVVVLVIAIGALLIGFVLGRAGGGRQAQATATATLAAEASPFPTIAVGEVIPTYTPMPVATAAPPTAMPTDTPIPEPMIAAQEGGVNVRSGPGTNFSTLGRLAGGQSAKVIGQYGEWWQIDYGGSPGWVANWVVNDSNTGGVPQVVPPASPIPPTAIPPTKPPAPTEIPATQAPDTRGLRADHFSVGLKVDGEEAVDPQPAYGNAGDIWFCFEVANTTAGTLQLAKVGAWAQETGDYQISWGGGAGPIDLGAGQYVSGGRWCDHFYNDKVSMGSGVHHIWLRVCFTDGYCVNLAGPISVNIG